MSMNFMNEGQGGSDSRNIDIDQNLISEGEEEEIDLKTLSLYGPLRSSSES